MKRLKLISTAASLCALLTASGETSHSPQTAIDALAERRRAPEHESVRFDEALCVTRARNGDADAFGQLMQRYEQPILGYLRRLVPRGDAALDLRQDVWLDAFRGLPNLQSPGAFLGWLYRIAHNKAASHIAREVRREAVFDPLEDGQEGEVEAVDDAFDAEAVHHALAQLPSHQREILTQRYLRDVSLEELAGELDCPAGTVKSRLYHARLALRRQMERQIA